ncbi:MAG: DUF2892 domain-containing protein [Alphaproteobacteria bacterium]|nr:DUF2892 domain-containing protein [Alphaproteobacteria bacterium]
MFQNNVGGIDKVLRIIVGVALLSLIFIGPKTWWGLIGLIPLGTALLGTCPLYSIIGVSTCPLKR